MWSASLNEFDTLGLQAACDKARSLDDTQKNAEATRLQPPLKDFLPFTRWWCATRIRIKQATKNVCQCDRCVQRAVEEPITNRLALPMIGFALSMEKKDLFLKCADDLQDQEHKDIQLYYRRMNVYTMNLHWPLFHQEMSRGTR